MFIYILFGSRDDHTSQRWTIVCAFKRVNGLFVLSMWKGLSVKDEWSFMLGMNVHASIYQIWIG